MNSDYLHTIVSANLITTIDSLNLSEICLTLTYVFSYACKD